MRFRRPQIWRSLLRGALVDFFGLAISAARPGRPAGLSGRLAPPVAPSEARAGQEHLRRYPRVSDFPLRLKGTCLFGVVISLRFIGLVFAPGVVIVVAPDGSDESVAVVAIGALLQKKPQVDSTMIFN